MATNLKLEPSGHPRLDADVHGQLRLPARTTLLLGDLAATALGVLVFLQTIAASQPLAIDLVEAVAGACMAGIVLLASGAYRVGELGPGRAHLVRVLPAVGWLAACAALIASAEPDELAPALWPLAGAASLLLYRLAAHARWVGAGEGHGQGPAIVLAGDPLLLERSLARLAASVGTTDGRPAVKVAARVELPEREAPEALAAGIEQLLEPVRRGEAETVLLALPWDDEVRVRQVVDRLEEHAVDVFLVGALIGLRDGRQAPDWLGGMPCVQVVSRPMRGWRALVKEGGDRLLALCAITALFVPLLLIWLAIRIDSKGPALYRQKRQGLNGRMFDILKFRTMYVDRCDSGLGAVAQATACDPRVTRVGRFLRRTSLDELPQLFNVLMGDMSLVGPRPHAVAHDEHYGRLIEHYAARHRVKPGITGWAQVNGYRGETDTLEKMRKRIEHDLDYIENWSPALDLRILLRTLRVGFLHPNAR
jgi:Undecaprenyl-phosphate glucose phosphotransferase